MTRAERRYRRMRNINKWLILCFTYWRWDKYNGWFKFPGYLAKRTSVCSCTMCQVSCWVRALDKRALDSDLGIYDKYMRKRNRLYRSPVHYNLRRGGISGTRV